MTNPRQSIPPSVSILSTFVLQFYAVKIWFKLEKVRLQKHRFKMYYVGGKFNLISSFEVDYLECLIVDNL